MADGTTLYNIKSVNVMGHQFGCSVATHMMKAF